MFKKLLAYSLLIGCLDVYAANEGIMKDFDSLGGNKDLLEQVGTGQARMSTQVVQDRIVKRRNRIEIAPEIGTVLGGDSYNKTTNYGINVHYHINPHWSLGAKYLYSANKLSKEGENLINDVSVTGRGQIPDIDYPKSEYLGVVNFYPIYGKMNLYDLGVVHFDVYALAGYGNIALRRGNTNTWVAGGGIGFWFSQHLTTRLELYYQTYQAQRYETKSGMDLTVASFQIGYML